MDTVFIQIILTPNFLPCTSNKIHKSMSLPVNVSKTAGLVANSVDHIQMRVCVV